MTPAWATRTSLDLPLLAKDLTELGARRRTYVVRSVYAALLFIVFGYMFYGFLGRIGAGSFLALGIGRELFWVMVVAQLVGVYVFLPATASSAITEEKEKRTLELLFTTHLTPGEIVFQKLVGRLVPMLTLLLLSLPLMAVCYAFGGLSTEDVFLAAVVLLTTCVQVGAFSIMVSAYCRTSGEALGATYTYAVGLFLAVWISMGLLGLMMAFTFGPVAIVPWAIAPGLAPPAALAFAGVGNIGYALLATLPAWAWTAVFLWKARKYLLSRAFLPPKRRRWSFFGNMVRYARREAAWKRHRGQLVEDTDLPGDEPVAWRETANTFLEWPRGFVAAAVGLEVVVLMLAVFAGENSAGTWDAWGITFLVYVFWALAAVAVTSRAAGAVASEREGRTLEVLLTTPLSGEEIVRQKAKAPGRLVMFFAAPLATLIVIEALLELGAHAPLDQLIYLALSTLSVFVFLGAFVWIAQFVGLRVRDRRRATFVALGVAFAWIAGPPVLAGLVPTYAHGPAADAVASLRFLSPAVTINFLESGVLVSRYGVAAASPALAGLVVAGGVLFLARRLCLRNADRYLGRPAVSAAEVRDPAPVGAAGGGAA